MREAHFSTSPPPGERRKRERALLLRIRHILKRKAAVAIKEKAMAKKEFCVRYGQSIDHDPWD